MLFVCPSLAFPAEDPGDAVRLTGHVLSFFRKALIAGLLSNRVLFFLTAPRDSSSLETPYFLWNFFSFSPGRFAFAFACAGFSLTCSFFLAWSSVSPLLVLLFPPKFPRCRNPKWEEIRAGSPQEPRCGAVPLVGSPPRRLGVCLGGLFRETQTRRPRRIFAFWFHKEVSFPDHEGVCSLPPVPLRHVCSCLLAAFCLLYMITLFAPLQVIILFFPLFCVVFSCFCGPCALSIISWGQSWAIPNPPAIGKTFLKLGPPGFYFPTKPFPPIPGSFRLGVPHIAPEPSCRIRFGVGPNSSRATDCSPRLFFCGVIPLELVRARLSPTRESVLEHFS